MPDANEGSASSTEQDANVAASSTAESQSAEPTLESVVDDVLAKAESSTSTEQEHKEESTESSPEKGPNAEEKQESAAEEQETAKAEAKESKQEEEQVPFHTHPRWVEMKTERDSLRSERDTLKERVGQYEQVVQAHKSVVDYCQRHNVTDEQYRAAVEIAALLNSDPAAAYEKLKPVVEKLATFSGDSLPSDLEQEVTEGLISLERAKELAQLRGRASLGEQRQKLSSEQLQQQARQSVVNALYSWEQSTLKTDPDFHPKSNGEPDGKYEWVCDKVRARFLQDPPTTVNDAVAVAQKIYEEVSTAFGRLIPRPPVARKTPSSAKVSSTKAEREPQTIEEVQEMVMSRHNL